MFSLGERRGEFLCCNNFVVQGIKFICGSNKGENNLDF